MDARLPVEAEEARPAGAPLEARLVAVLEERRVEHLDPGRPRGQHQGAAGQQELRLVGVAPGAYARAEVGGAEEEAGHAFDAGQLRRGEDAAGRLHHQEERGPGEPRRDPGDRRGLLALGQDDAGRPEARRGLDVGLVPRRPGAFTRRSTSAEPRSSSSQSRSARARAASFASGRTPSSRSTMSASAPREPALRSMASDEAGT